MCTGTNASVPLPLGFDLACDDGVRSRTNSSSSVSFWTGVSISLSSCSIVVALWVRALASVFLCHLSVFIPQLSDRPALQDTLQFRVNSSKRSRPICFHRL